MSYFEYFTANIQNDFTEAIKGTCELMCPQEESEMREREKLVHVLEVWGPVKKLVKCYTRSAADSNMVKPHLLRPYSVLRQTVQFLVLDITKRPESAVCIYNFVDDRLRAVRQDMTIQRLAPQECVNLLEPMIRFYVFFGYKLCNLTYKDFDPVLHKKYLLECMKLFLKCSEEPGDISHLFFNLDLSCKLKCDRGLIESLYILSNLDSTDPLYRYLLLSKDLKSHPKLLLSFKIALANLKRNYVAVCALMDQLCPLTYCALCVYLPVIQRQAVLIMSVAYNSKALSVPLSALRRWLRFDSDAQAQAACAQYGLTVKGGNVNFVKTDFKTDAPVLQPTKLLQMDKKYDFSIDNIFTYTTSL